MRKEYIRFLEVKESNVDEVLLLHIKHAIQLTKLRAVEVKISTINILLDNKHKTVKPQLEIGKCIKN